jgi:hypothetical protein
VFWRPELLVDLVCLGPPPPPWRDAARVRFDPWAWPGRKSMLLAGDGVHLLVAGSPAGDLRLWLPGRPELPTLGDPLGFHVPSDLYAAERAAAALRFWHFAADPPVTRAAPRAPPPWRDATRLALMLFVLDLRAIGFSHRDIARILHDAAPGPDWADSAGRQAVRRLLADADALVGGGYRNLLMPPKRRPR